LQEGLSALVDRLHDDERERATLTDVGVAGEGSPYDLEGDRPLWLLVGNTPFGLFLVESHVECNGLRSTVGE